MKEQAIVGQILEYCGRASIPAVHVRNTGGIYRDSRGEVKFGRSRYSQKGAPDILLCHRGIAFGFEVKSMEGVKSAEQYEWQTKWEKQGGRYFIVRSLDDFLKCLSA